VDEPKTATSQAWLETANGQKTTVRAACYLGRAATSNVVINDEKVSRRHAMIHQQGAQEYWLIDLGSSNGTYLNGRRVTSPTRLNHGDRVEIAKYSFTFHQLNAAAPKPELDRSTEQTLPDIKTVTCFLLVADIEKVAPEEVSRVTGRWLSSCKQVIDDEKGVINKFLGDGFFAYWNASAPDSAAQVARVMTALNKMQNEGTLRFRIVVHHGKAFVGGASLGEESFMGGEVNFIFRAEKLASKLAQARLVSATAAAELKSLLPMTSVGPHEVPSFEGTYEFFTY
jgi:adenylate cyclase